MAALVTGMLALSLLGAARASAQSFLPPGGKSFFGVGDGNEVGQFRLQLGRHPAVFGPYVKWREPVQWAIDTARHARSRLVLSLAPARRGVGFTTPQAIARGEGDDYLLYLNRTIAAGHLVTYVNLMAEMNGHWNPYCAYNLNGRSRGQTRSTRAFRQAWRRAVLILRGGRLNRLNAHLHALGMRRVTNRKGTKWYRDLPAPHVAFIWVPQTVGAPAIRANSPHAYWPGGTYVDWVGTDFYARFINYRPLERLYRDFHKPFAFGEWGLWGTDNVTFVKKFFGWLRRHPRVRMTMYFQGDTPHSLHRLSRYKRSGRLLHHLISENRFALYAPELAPPHHHHRPPHHHGPPHHHRPPHHH